MKKLLPFLICVFSISISFGQTFERVEHLIGFGDLQNNNGVAVADYDQDQDLDVFVVAWAKDENDNPISKSKLFRNNNNGSFTDVTDQTGIDDLVPFDQLDSTYDGFKGLEGYKFGAFWGDYDNDGYPDLFLTNLAFVHLFHNNGDGTFTDVTTSSGITKRNECGNTGAVWFDYNNDSFLDLYIADWATCDGNLLYVNNGDGSFTDVSDLVNYDTVIRASFNPFPFDFNNDGWMDLYVTNDYSIENQLFINQSGNSFTEEAVSYGVNTAENDMGIAYGDFNLDQNVDLFITSINNNFLLINGGNNIFNNVANFQSVDDSGWAWGTKFTDLDLDGDEDLFVVNGFGISSAGSQHNEYYNNLYAQGESNFEALDVGLNDLGISVEVLDFDFDSDGDIDLFVTNSDRGPFFYENRSIINPETNPDYLQWFKVSLEGTISNRDAIGTTVYLETTQGNFVRYFNGVGFLGQSLKPVHFGLDASADIISLEIHWPSGLEETYTDLSQNTHIKAIENQGYEILDDLFLGRPQGCINPDACNYDPDAIEDDGSCSFLPVTGSISGNTNPGYLSTETYSYALLSGQSIIWDVEGGHVVDGFGTNEITVKWDFTEQGKLSAYIHNDSCRSLDFELAITKSMQNVPEHISVARLWNEALLFAIRNDFARPTVHARNLFHTHAAMYDVWAIVNGTQPYLMGNQLNGFVSTLEDVDFVEDEAVVNEAISYAAYRILQYRFQNAPQATDIQAKLDLLMTQLGYDLGFTETNYLDGNAAALGNAIADIYILYGNIDQSRELSEFDNEYYTPANPPLAPVIPGNSGMVDPNRWQSLSLDTYIDQSGNEIPGTSIDFLSPEWGNVFPFAQTDNDQTFYAREGNTYIVYNDASQPPILDPADQSSTDLYLWGFSIVSVWSSHLNPNDGVRWDISPRSIGNLPISSYPDTFSDLVQFYDFQHGGVNSQGRNTNPMTGQPYEAHIVPRGDYTRVVAEYWADGPDSETPPGHWFTILNDFVNDYPDFERRFLGEGEELSSLEWDIKAYFTLGGAMHDSAISAWSNKGWYDYPRPISAIRYMGDQGQSTNSNLTNYDSFGYPLIDNHSAIVSPNDPLSGRDRENVGKIKIKAWKGHSFIDDPEVDQAGVDWILVENWWPYQRPSFVTPPFAGYVSGHSTFSRAAAEVLTEITGSEFFPGGLAEFHAGKNSFLVFEEGPSVDVTLQWATYRDASDQSSLSRIWGGIHPPMDDIPGRKIGEKVGKEAVEYAKEFFVEDQEPIVDPPMTTETLLYPNPVQQGEDIYITNSTEDASFILYDMVGRPMPISPVYGTDQRTTISLSGIAAGNYILVSGENHWFLIVQ